MLRTRDRGSARNGSSENWWPFVLFAAMMAGSAIVLFLVLVTP
jgi:hypothetical protein